MFIDHSQDELEQGLCLINDAFSKLREAEQKFLSLKAYMDFTGFGNNNCADISNTSTGMSPISPMRTLNNDIESQNHSVTSGGHDHDVFVNEIPMNPFAFMSYPQQGAVSTDAMYTPTLNSFEDIHKQLGFMPSTPKRV